MAKKQFSESLTQKINIKGEITRKVKSSCLPQGCFDVRGEHKKYLFDILRGGRAFVGRWGEIEEPLRGEPGSCVEDVLPQTVQEGIIEPEWANGVDRRDLFQEEEVFVAAPGGEFQEGGLEGFFVLVVPFSRFRLVFLKPGVLGGQVTFADTHLADPSCHQFFLADQAV